MPTLWAGSNTLGTNYGTGNFYADHTTGAGRFAFASNGYFCTELVASGTYNISFWMRISSSPFENIQLGYCTNQSNIGGTFISLQTIYNNSTAWVNYNFSITLPANSYITWSCAGGFKTHVLDDVIVGLATGINSTDNNLTFETFPNPSKGIFTIIPGTTDKALVEIYNISGEIICKTTTIAQQTKIDLSKQPKGIYFVQLLDNNSNVTRKKIVVQ